MTWSLRRINETDVDWIYEACQDPLIQQWTMVPRPYTHEHAINFTRDLAGELAVWAIQRIDIERPLGVISVHGISDCDALANIGYWMAPWGRGLGGMKAALTLLIDELRSWGNVSGIQATIAGSNLASRRSVESAGFKLLGDSDRKCRCGDEEVSAVTYQLKM